MAYVVRKVRNGPQSKSAKLIDQVRYPPTEVEGVVSTDIDLWEVEYNVGGILTPSYIKSVLNFKKDYNILLQQTDPVDNGMRTFVLYEGSDIDKSHQAFKTVCATINPLVDDCTLLLTKDLLEEIITPLPVEPSNLAHHLVEVIKSSLDAHPDWVRVLRTLALDAIGKDETDSGETVAKLLDHGVDAGASNRKGNTALHLAGSRRSIKQIVKKASVIMSEEELKHLLNQTNKEGKTALHRALQKDNSEVVDELIQAGADFDTVTQDEDGSNAFHVAAESGSSKGIGRVHYSKDKFLQKESPSNPQKQRLLNALNTFNKKGLTPLMICINQAFFDIAVLYLQAGANPNVAHPESGNTALHMAVEKGNTSLVKALIAFGTNIDIKNKDGKTALDLASDECAEILHTTASKRKEAYSRYSNAKLDVTDDPDSIFLLSMDGGGMRGLLLLQTLLAIQKRMEELQPDCAPMHTYFDYIAGTSSGGLTAVCLVGVNATLEAIRSMMFKTGDDLSSLSITYPAEVVDYTTQQNCGTDTYLTDVTTPRVIVPTVMADTSPPVLHLMCNYGEARNGDRPPHEWKLWEVCRATSAAPFYFPPFEEKFVDGGVMANNPTLTAMTEIVQQSEKEGKKPKITLVVSIGTGVQPPTKNDDVGVYVPNVKNAFKSLRNLGNTFSAFTNMFHLLISQATAADGPEVECAKAWCKMIGSPYYRLSLPFEEPVEMTEFKKVILTDMLYQCTLYLYDNAEQVDSIARLLLSRKRHCID